MSKYKKSKPRYQTHAARIRKPLFEMAAANKREWNEVTAESCEKGVRARLQTQFPDSSPEDIETRVGRIMATGSKPTNTVAPQPEGIPKEVLAARKAERKRRVDANHHIRRQDEIVRKIERENRRTPPAGGQR